MIYNVVFHPKAEDEFRELFGGMEINKRVWIQNSFDVLMMLYKKLKKILVFIRSSLRIIEKKW
jgi:hypothetical protein